MSKDTEKIFLIKFDKPASSAIAKEVIAIPNLESINDFTSVCRVCANVSDVVVPIFEGEGLQNRLADKINDYLPIQVWQEDDLPQVLCSQCMQAVLSWHSLTLVSQQADAALRKRSKAIEALKEQSKSANNETEKILDNVLTDRDEGEGAVCGYCGATLALKQDLHKHLVNSHLNQLFLCEECDTYVDLTDFLVHMTGHAAQYETPKDKPIEEATDENQNDTSDPPAYSESPEQIIKATDSRDNEFSDHSETDYGFGPLPVSVFEAIEDSQDSQAENERTSNTPDVVSNDSTSPPKKKRKPKQYTCEICSKVYNASSSYFYHKKNHHGPVKQHECTACGKKFTSKDCLRQHTLTHGDEYQYKCDSCEKKFRTKASLYIHKQTHTGVKKFSCGQCAMSFRWRTHLARHLVRHAGARGHACGTCSRAFSVRADLLRHARTHTAHSHACPHCPLHFAQLRYLKAHQANKHPTAKLPCAT